MKNKLLFSVITLTLIILNSTNCEGQSLEAKAWNTFEGKLGDKDFQLSVYLFANGTIKGNYVYRDSIFKISLNGTRKANALFLKEVNSPGELKGNLFTDTLDKFEGIRTDSLKNLSQKFFLRLTSITWGDYNNRYSNVYGTTEEIENFMQKIKTAILTNDKDWIADHVHYPTRHVLDKGYTSINNKQELLQYYDQVVNTKFKEKIRHDYTTNLFYKNGAVMLGNGEIWIINTSNSTKDKFDFIIATIQ